MKWGTIYEMIMGTYNIPRVVRESICRIVKDYFLTEEGDYRIHSTTLMPLIPFPTCDEDADPYLEDIDDSIFLNDKDTKLIIKKQIYVQWYLTTYYQGRAPLEYYGPPTLRGRQFTLICHDCNPGYNERRFGTKDTMRGYSNNANQNEIYHKSKA